MGDRTTVRSTEPAHHSKGYGNVRALLGRVSRPLRGAISAMHTLSMARFFAKLGVE